MPFSLETICLIQEVIGFETEAEGDAQMCDSKAQSNLLYAVSNIHIHLFLS